MKILIVAHFTQIPSEKGNNRFNYLANLLGENNQVELITSGFSHKFKRKRKLTDEEKQKLNYKLTMIDEPGYKKNVSLKRFYSHYKMSINLKKYLKQLDYKPDVIYCAVPSLDIAKVTAKYAKKNNIKFIIDVQDLWPEAFQMVFNIPVISNIIFSPMKRQADYIYKSANNVVAVSQTYLDRALKVNNKSTKNEVVFLGTKMDTFDKFKSEKNKENDGMIKIAYIGTLGHSYDIKIIIDAISILNKKGINNIQFMIMGDGPLKGEFEEYAKQKGINHIFTGILEYSKMIEKLTSCDIVVNPIKKLAAQSIINKVGDYAMAGLPVINTQENEEYRNLVEKYNIGYNCKNGDANDIAEKIEKLCNNKKLRDEYGTNNRKLAEEKFDRNKTYVNILKLIE